MSTRISDVLIAALLVLTTGCTMTRMETPARLAMTVAGQEIMLVAPDGLCFDGQSADVNPAGGFVLVVDCVATGDAVADVPRINAAMTALVSRDGLPGDLDALERFLTTAGLVTLGKSGEADQISVLSSVQRDGVLLIKVRDQGTQPLPGASDTFWRGFFEVSGRLVGTSVTGFSGADLSDNRAQSLLTGFANGTRAANAPESGV